MKPDIIKQAKIIFNSKLEFETIQKIAFDRGFHWINQSPSKCCFIFSYLRFVKE